MTKTEAMRILALFVGVGLMIVLIHYLGENRREMYHRGLQAGFAAAICPNVNQKTLNAIQDTMASIDHCDDFNQY